MTYLAWYENGDKTPLSDRVRHAMDNYKARFGVVPNVVETSFREEPFSIEGMSCSRVNIPKFHILVGVDHETSESNAEEESLQRNVESSVLQLETGVGEVPQQVFEAEVSQANWQANFLSLVR